jgi:hypothetical protein
MDQTLKPVAPVPPRTPIKMPPTTAPAHADEGRDDEASGIVSWQQELCQKPGDEADHYPAYDAHRLPSFRLYGIARAVPVDQIRHQRVPVVHSLADLVGGIPHVHKRHHSCHYHHRE